MQLEEASFRELLEELITRCEVFVAVASGLPGERIPTIAMKGSPLAQVGAATVLNDHLRDKYAAIDVDDVDTDDDE